MKAATKAPLLLAAVCTGLPGCVMAQPDAPASPDTAAFVMACNMQEAAAPASGALPARASTKPEPQLGTVAPATRVPSHVMTPSMRAMQKASAAQAGEKADVDKNAQMPCRQPSKADASKEGGSKPAGN